AWPASGSPASAPASTPPSGSPASLEPASLPPSLAGPASMPPSVAGGAPSSSWIAFHRSGYPLSYPSAQIISPCNPLLRTSWYFSASDGASSYQSCWITLEVSVKFSHGVCEGGSQRRP